MSEVPVREIAGVLGPAAPVRSASGEATRQRILAAATDLFIEHGYEGTPMSRVARNAGVTTAALYWHFESKDELYFTVVKGGYDIFRDELLARSVGDSVEQRFRRYIRVFVKLQLRDPRLTYGYQQLREALPDDKAAVLDDIRDACAERLRQILDDGRANGLFEFADLAVTTMALMTLCEYVFTWYRPEGRLSVNELADLYVTLARRMVTPAAAAG